MCDVFHTQENPVGLYGLESAQITFDLRHKHKLRALTLARIAVKAL